MTILLKYYVMSMQCVNPNLRGAENSVHLLILCTYAHISAFRRIRNWGITSIIGIISGVFYRKWTPRWIQKGKYLSLLQKFVAFSKEVQMRGPRAVPDGEPDKINTYPASSATYLPPTYLPTFFPAKGLLDISRTHIF